MSTRAMLVITSKSMTATGKAANDIFKALQEINMAKRVKPVLQLPVIKSTEEADAVLAEIAAHRRKIELYEIGLRESVDALKTECTDKCEAHKQAIEVRGQALMQFALARREDVFKGKKSVTLTFGSFGFRLTSTLKTLRKVSWDQVLNLVKSRKLAKCIRTKEEVDKDVLRKMSAETLAAVGCKLVVEDSFYYELADTDLASNE